MMKMKKVLLLVFAAILILSVAACSSETSGGSDNGNGSSGESNVEEGAVEGSESDASGTVRIAIAGWQLENGIDPITGEESIGLDQFLEESFYDNYPNIELEVTQMPWENAQANQQAMLLSGDVDLLISGFGSIYYNQGLLRGIDELIEGDTNFDTDIYLEGIMSNYNILSPDQSEVFGLPVTLGRRVTMYDKQLFDEWDVEYLSDNPTPEEVLEKAVQMTGTNPVTGEQNYGLWWSGNALNASTFVALTYAYGADGAEGTLDDLANIEWKLNEPEMVEVFEWIEEAAKLPPPAFLNGQGDENFGLENNTIAIALDHSGASVVSEFKSGNEEVLDRYESTLNLGPNGEGWVVADTVMMAKDAENVEAAWEVMKFFAGYERLKHFYEHFNYTPTLQDADFIDPNDKYIETALEIADITQPTLMDEANPFFSGEMVPAINGFYSEAHNGEAPDIQDFLDSLQERAEDWSENQ